MKFCNTKKIDVLGRITLPKEAKQMGFDFGVAVEIYMDGDALVLKVSPHQTDEYLKGFSMDENKKNIC